MIRSAGCTNTRYLNIRLSVNVLKWYPKEIFKSVLVHEMIHVWQFINELEEGHGTVFTDKMNELNNKYPELSIHKKFEMDGHFT